MATQERITEARVRRVAEGARDRSPIEGYTHNFYRYPARFSPRFAEAAITAFTKPGDLAGEPYMGGGTAVVQALAMGRDVVGNDLNSLSHFVTKVKVTPLNRAERNAVLVWAEKIAPTLSYSQSQRSLAKHLSAPETKNLELDRGRYIKKLIAAGLDSLGDLPTRDAEDFVRCILLRVSQWALDGRRSHTSLEEFREKLSSEAALMLDGMEEFTTAIDSHVVRPRSYLHNGDAAHFDELPVFAKYGRKVRLQISSPPYPGVHMLYHRWQVDGRRETPAPYWIAGRKDGESFAYYNFGSRAASGMVSYFNNSLLTLKAIRNTMTDDGIFVQMVAFSDPKIQMPLYLKNMEEAGFKEFRRSGKRIWRQVPHRKWHATQQKTNQSSREVVFIHSVA
jgi:hypothetical protein